MVKIDDLPFAAGAGEFLLEPLELTRVHRGAVQSEEADAAVRSESVVPLAAHIELLIRALIGGVMIAERRVELHARIQQRFVRQLELSEEIVRRLPAVDVVAQHQDDLEVDLLLELGKAVAGLVLGAPTGSGIADYGEAK